uniref:Uncharacterized protein At5g39865 family n=1 Tax=Cajanus cajan TaxID=3821 RepID=A0A151RP41_CAJCA|nr:Uncharacterized protein At5g39865 family [Cajanus cajan]
MGCANSKPKGCQHCHCNCDTPYYSSVPRSFSVHVHHPPQSKGDSYHVVALTSTTLGSLDHGNVVLKTPTSTPPHEPETINTWELMEGLEDTTSPFRSPKHFKSFSFDVNVNGHGLSIEEEKVSNDVVMDLKGGKEKVVLYFTSLRGVRKTYEDCCHVRLILKGLGVRLDERDVSMHSGFKEELKELLGHGYGKGGLPRVFVGRNYIGGAEDIQQLHEDGQLGKLLDCCEKIDDTTDGVDDGGVCEACGDIRFVPCETCFGSCKIYYEGDNDDDQEEQEDGEVGEFGFQRCPDCNENGLIRCPMCCY